MTEDSAYAFGEFPMPPNSDEDELQISDERPFENNKIKIRNSVIQQFSNLEFDNTNSLDIFKIAIFMCTCDQPSNIIKITFDKLYTCQYDYELVSKIHYYCNYVKISDKTVNQHISVFGEIYDIFTCIIINCLDKLCHNENVYSIKLNISKNENQNSINYPIYENSSIIEFDRVNNNNTFYECPICYNEYNEGSKIQLNCNHCVCKVCFYNLIKNCYNSEHNCPVCRQNIEF